MAPFTMVDVGLIALAGISQGIAKYKEGEREYEANEYRASLAEENARREEFLLLDKEFRAKQEGLLDAGLFRMKAELSGLSGVSRDLWVGQRMMATYKDITNARQNRSQVVGRFLKEAGWHRKSASAMRSSAKFSVAGTALTTAAEIRKIIANG